MNRPASGSSGAVLTPENVALGVAVMVHALLLGLVLGRELDILFNDAMHRLGPGTDFAVFYNAATKLLAGEGLYGHGPAFGYRYHPLFAAALTPLIGYVDFATAFALWVTLHELALVWVAVALWRSLDAPRVRAASIVILLVATPYLLDVFMGQNTALAAAFVAVAMLRYRSERRVLSGVHLAVAIIIKPLALAFVPIFLARREWKLVGAVLGGTLALAVPFFAADPRGVQLFVRINTEAVPAPGWVVHAGHMGLHGLVARVLAAIEGVDIGEMSSFDELSLAGAGLLAVYPLALVALSGWATHRLRDRVGACTLLWAATFLLAYKDVWEHTYALVFPLVGVVIADRELRASRVFWTCIVALALPTLFPLYDLQLPPGPYDPDAHWSLGVSLVHHATKPVFTLGLYGLCVRLGLSGR